MRTLFQLREVEEVDDRRPRAARGQRRHRLRFGADPLEVGRQVGGGDVVASGAHGREDVIPMTVALPFAHALVAKQDLPIPAWLFAWAASIVLVVSFFALSAAWRKPQFEEERWRPSAAWLTAVLRSWPLQVLCGGPASSSSGSASTPASMAPKRPTATSRSPSSSSPLDRLPARLGAARQRLPGLQPVAGDRPGRGRRLRVRRPAAAGAPRLPGEARPLARRCRPARLRLARGRLRLERRRRRRSRTARGGRRRQRLHGLHAGDDGPVRDRGLVRAR